MHAFRSLLNPLFSLAARSCEKSETVANLVRNLDFKGKGSIIQRLRPEAMQREETVDCEGIRYQLDLRDDVQRELYFNYYEREDVRQALALVPVGGTCLDIGANNGAFALQMARKVGESGTVHAFEPDRYIFSRLLQNCRLNHFENRLYCHNAAVTNVNGSLPFYISDRCHSGWGSLTKFDDIARHAENIKGVTLDHFLTINRIQKVDLLKVDVEAHEPELLEGAKNSLLNRVFRFILIEFNGIRLSQRNITFEDFLRPFINANYAPVKLRLDLIRKIQARQVLAEMVCVNFLFAAPILN